MLKYIKLDYRPWPVTITSQVCDETTGDVTEKEDRFIGKFTRFDESDLLALRLEVFGDETDAKNKQRLADMPIADYAQLEARFFAGLLSGWSQVADDDGDITYSANLLQALCTGPDGAAFRRGFSRAISEIRFGVAPAKNAETSPSAGLAPAAGEVVSPS